MELFRTSFGFWSILLNLLLPDSFLLHPTCLSIPLSKIRIASRLFRANTITFCILKWHFMACISLLSATQSGTLAFKRTQPLTILPNTLELPIQLLIIMPWRLPINLIKSVSPDFLGALGNDGGVIEGTRSTTSNPKPHTLARSCSSLAPATLLFHEILINI